MRRFLCVLMTVLCAGVHAEEVLCVEEDIVEEVAICAVDHPHHVYCVLEPDFTVYGGNIETTADLTVMPMYFASVIGRVRVPLLTAVTVGQTASLGELKKRFSDIFQHRSEFALSVVLSSIREHADTITTNAIISGIAQDFDIDLSLKDHPKGSQIEEAGDLLVRQVGLDPDYVKGLMTDMKDNGVWTSIPSTEE